MWGRWGTYRVLPAQRRYGPAPHCSDHGGNLASRAMKTAAQQPYARDRSDRGGSGGSAWRVAPACRYLNPIALKPHNLKRRWLGFEHRGAALDSAAGGVRDTGRAAPARVADVLLPVAARLDPLAPTADL